MTNKREIRFQALLGWFLATAPEILNTPHVFKAASLHLHHPEIGVRLS
jgi:hypothetical protein